MSNPVNHPDHYNQGPIECIDFLDWTGDVVPFSLESAKKYLWRCPDKHGLQDLEKALWYLNYAYRQRVREPQWVKWCRQWLAYLNPPAVQDIDAVLDEAKIFHQRNVFQCLFLYSKTGHLIHLEYAIGQLQFNIHVAEQEERKAMIQQAEAELNEATH
ncbi:MAG: DUF3310 domain-containing protein [Stenomitos frigidus ULC029]